MYSSPVPEVPTVVMETRASRRLSLSQEHLVVEVRGPRGSWIPARAIPLLDIRAAYSYEVRDWNLLGIGLILGCLFGFALFLMAVALSWSTALQFGVSVGAFVLCLAVAAVRILTKPKPLLRVDAYSGQLLFPNEDRNQFFRQLTARLAPLTVGVSPPVSAPAVAPPPVSQAPAASATSTTITSSLAEASGVVLPEIPAAPVEARPEPSVTLDPSLFPPRTQPAGAEDWRQSPPWSLAAQEDAEARASKLREGGENS